MRFSRFLYLLIFFFLQKPLFSQSFDGHTSGSWLQFSGTNKIHDRWSIPLSGILRHHDLFEIYDFSFLRTGASYHFNGSITLTCGIAYVNSKSYPEVGEASVTSQYWLYEELAWKTKFHRNTLSHRWRLENRWVRNSGKTNFNNRFRYRLQYQRPFNQSTFIKSYNEIFVNLSGSLFNQNRFYLGIGREVSSSLKVEMGYLKSHFSTFHHNAVLMAVTFNTTLRATQQRRN